MSLGGYATQPEADTEIVSAYSASAQSVPAVATPPGWFKTGTFYLRKNLRCRLEFIGGVSSSDLVGTARLFDPTAGVNAAVSGSDVTFSNLSNARQLSGAFDLVGDRTYLVLVQCIGPEGGTKFATVGTAALAGI